MDDRPTVLAIGEPLIELADIGDQRLEWTFGGDTFNCLAAVVAAAPSIRARYLTGLGDDPASTWFMDFADRLGIDTSRSPVVPGRNVGLSWISRTDGDRTFRYWRGESAARSALRSGLPIDDDTGIAVVSSITLAVAGPAADALIDDLGSVRRAGTTVALDTNHRPALWPDGETARRTMERALGMSDIVHASLDDVAVVWGDDAEGFCDRAAAAGVRQVVVTDGPGPVTALVDGKSLTSSANPVSAVDTTGAGDAFFGTYLGCRLRGDEAADALDRAVEVATTVVMTRGALTYLDQTAD